MTAPGRSETDAFADGRRCGERLHSGWTRGRSRPTSAVGDFLADRPVCSV